MSSSTLSDEAMARQLDEQWNMLCDDCERNPKNPGFLLCTECYNQRRLGYYRQDYLREDATYEEICAWEERRNNEAKVSQGYLASMLPSITFTKAHKRRKTDTDDADVCSICMENFNDNDTLSILPCAHKYHTDCIKPWFDQGDTTCPHCKFDVKSALESQ